MNTILTDDERDAIRSMASCSDDHEGHIDENELISLTEAAVLAKLREQEPVAWLLTGPYEKRAFTDLSSADACCRGLNKGFGEEAYTVTPLVPYAAPPIADWYCEAHPEHLMGHDGCTGGGIPECARVGQIANQLRIARQEIREIAQHRDDLVAQYRAALAAPLPAVVQVPLTDEDIERIAVKHEAFGLGQVDAKGFTTHGFDPDGLRAFVREILAAPLPAVVQVPQGIAERIAEAHDASLDDDHAECRGILKECLRLLAAAPEAPAQGDPLEKLTRIQEELSLYDDKPAVVQVPPIPLNIIRKWPDGFEERLQHVWKDVISFIPNVKLWDLQRVLAEFGFRMEVYDQTSAPEAPATAVVQTCSDERPCIPCFTDNGPCAAQPIPAPKATARGSTWLQRRRLRFITEAYEAGVGKGMQAINQGEEVQNPWGDEPYREAWELGYKEGKARYRPEAQPIPAPWREAVKVARDFVQEVRRTGDTRLASMAIATVAQLDALEGGE